MNFPDVLALIHCTSMNVCYMLRLITSDFMGTLFALFLTVVPVGLLLHFYARYRGKDITLN